MCVSVSKQKCNLDEMVYGEMRETKTAGRSGDQLKFIDSDELQVNCGADLKPDEHHYKILVTHGVVLPFLES